MSEHKFSTGDLVRIKGSPDYWPAFVVDGSYTPDRIGFDNTVTIIGLQKGIPVYVELREGVLELFTEDVNE